MANVRARDLVGRKIVAVRFNRFPAWMENQRARRGEWANNPVLVLDNGRELKFVVQETDVGEYGVELRLTARPPRGAR